MWLDGGQVHIAIIRSAELSVSLVWLCPRAQCRWGDCVISVVLRYSKVSLRGEVGFPYELDVNLVVL